MSELRFWWPYTWLRQLWCWVRGHDVDEKCGDPECGCFYHAGKAWCVICGKVWR